MAEGCVERAGGEDGAGFEGLDEGSGAVGAERARKSLIRCSPGYFVGHGGERLNVAAGASRSWRRSAGGKAVSSISGNIASRERSKNVRPFGGIEHNALRSA